MTTGYQGPGRTLVHRLKRSQVGAVLVEQMWCGVKPDLTRWTALADTEPSCPVCIRLWNVHVAEQAPFLPGERVVYTGSRHPGLMHFNPIMSGGKAMAWSWRVNGAPRTHWQASQDERAPTDRPIQLGYGLVGVEPVSYHATVLDAIEWTKAMVRTESLVSMYRALRAGIWDPQAHHLPLSDTASGTLKETNPA